MKRCFFIAFPLALLASAPAIAACDTANTFRFDWNSQAQQAQTYSTTYNYNAANGLAGTRAFSVRATSNGLAVTTVGGYPTPLIASVNQATTGTGQFTYTIGGRFTGRTAAITGATRVAVATITFSAAVRDLTFRIHDIDFRANEYRDWVRVVGRNGAATYSPVVTKPAASTVRIGSNGAAPAVAAGDLLGASESQVAQDVGTVTVAFAQPVTSVEVRYGNYPLQAGETATGEQWISIYDLAFCPLPTVSVSKTSISFATVGPDRFRIPGTDVIYTLTVTNSGGSPVDLNGMVLTDLLPAQSTFYNGDFDPVAAGTNNFGFVPGTSGVTLLPANVAYSNNNGTSYAYSPAAGYDAAVNRVRFAPGGTMAANSTFSISFRARIR